MISRSKYPTKLYTDHSALKSIFIERSDTYGKIAHQMDKLTEYNYKVYHWPCKANII